MLQYDEDGEDTVHFIINLFKIQQLLQETMV